MFRTFLLVLMVLAIGLYVQPSIACGSNTPAQLEERAQGHFKKWDVNHDQFLQVEEFVAGDGYILGVGADEAAWVQFLKDKIPLIDVFKQADTDHSNGLSYQEWVIIRPLKGFMLKGGC